MYPSPLGIAAITRFHLDSMLKVHPILQSRQTESVQLSASPYHLLPRAERAPVGQTSTHAPQNPQFESICSLLKAVPTLVL